MKQFCMMWKRFWALILAVCLVGAMLPVVSITTMAEQGEDVAMAVADNQMENTEPVKQEEAEPVQAGEDVLLLEAGNNFALSGTSFTYATLKEALADAYSGDVMVMTAAEYTLTESLVIPSGVTLMLPYVDGSISVNGSSHKHPYANNASNGSVNQISWPENNRMRVLTVAADVTLTVGEGAKLVLGGQYSSSSSGLGGQTCGSHSDIVLESGAEILVTDGGLLSTMGYITGEGSVSVSAGGKVYQPFVITDYHGGAYTAVSFMTKKQSPFNSHGMFNIQCDMTMDSTSYLYGYCDLYAQSSHNTTTSLVVGPSGALLNLGTGTTVEFTYDEDYSVSAHYGIGRTTMAIDGDASLGSLSMKVSSVTVETSDVTFPLSYNYRLEQMSGTLTLDNAAKLMPGAEVYVAEDAKLSLGSTLLVYDGFDARAYSGIMYPTSAALSAAGLSERARLVVDGEMELKNGCTFAGIVETGGTGKISIDSNVTLGKTVGEGVVKGDKYTYIFIPFSVDRTSKTEYVLDAKIGDYRTLGAYLPMTEGNTYYAADDALVESGQSFAYSTFNDSNVGTVATGTYTSAEEIRGTWAIGFNITFLDGEETVEIQTGLVPGDDITPPEIMVPSGMTFAGWNTQADGEGKALPETCGRGDLTVYAIWRQDSATYQATWVVDGEAVKTESYPVGTETVHPEAPVKEGYTFAVWESETGENGDVIYTATWNVNQYIVTWDVDGEKTEVPYAYGAAIVKPEDPVKDGYTFAGWQGYADGATMGAEDVTYTALWIGNIGIDVKLDGTSVTVEIRNTTTEDANCVLIVAAYSENQQMLSAELKDTMLVTASGTVTEKVTFELETVPASIRVFLMDETYEPILKEMDMATQ